MIQIYITLSLAILSIPLLFNNSQIHDYYIATKSGSFVKSGKLFACINAKCYKFTKTVNYKINDYVEIRTLTTPKLTSNKAFWFISFIILVGVMLYFITKSEQVEKKIKFADDTDIDVTRAEEIFRSKFVDY
ncbi:Transmembrane domain-containing protein [Spironucleus salmonicida]|uniref:Transmembrane domain-containing protein n=1 Tax=Spironucleus salmonicida TaxID=348837 RepID=V6M0M0_9EUKA|nr:Transmembrane domain-containing protein [Spironucleus salmonicida]|eukprot:EST46659.1 Transmembrane domain-containing protein [Spironucleus salmonicida]